MGFAPAGEAITASLAGLCVLPEILYMDLSILWIDEKTFLCYIGFQHSMVLCRKYLRRKIR